MSHHRKAERPPTPVGRMARLQAQAALSRPGSRPERRTRDAAIRARGPPVDLQVPALQGLSPDQTTWRRPRRRASNMTKLYELGAIPVDANAARAVQPGTHWTPEFKTGHIECSDTPLLTAPIPATCANLTGIKFARFTVVGYSHKKSGGTRAHVWVCRCLCGRYERRTERAVLKGKDADDKCLYCRELEFQRKEDRVRQLGAEVADAMRDRELAARRRDTLTKP